MDSKSKKYQARARDMIALFDIEHLSVSKIRREHQSLGKKIRAARLKFFELTNCSGRISEQDLLVAQAAAWQLGIYHEGYDCMLGIAKGWARHQLGAQYGLRWWTWVEQHGLAWLVKRQQTSTQKAKKARKAA
jgi:hypothetical protein